MPWREIAAVFVGGFVGTAARLGIDLAIPHGDDEFPWSTLLINIGGAFALGLLVSRLWPTAPDWLRAGLGTGLLGSFTTFSAVAVGLVSLGAAGQWMPALAYLAASVLLGLAAAALGLAAGRSRTPATREVER